MKYRNIFFLFVLALASLTSCKKDFLDRAPLDIVSDDAVFSDEGYVESLLSGLYNYMPNGFPGRGQSNGTPNRGSSAGFTSMLDMNTDIVLTKSGWIETWRHLRSGNMSPTNNPLDIWNDSYQGIFLANSMLERLAASELEADFIARTIADVRFVKGVIYFDLARRYGGVPLIKQRQTLEDDLLVARSSEAEVYAYIDEELTAAAAGLPSVADLSSNELGRATREAALAFNGRAQLFAKNYARSAELSKAVMDGNQYELASDYNGLFQDHGGNKEVIFETLFNGVDKGHGVDRLMLPFTYRADWGSQGNPTQEFVDSYEMANGLPITDPASGYNPLKPYEGRESRFYGTILYQGAPFIGRNLDVIFPDGADAPLRTGLHTITGYYITKFMDQSAPFGVDFGNSKQSWKEMRLAEVLLNYAEAKNAALSSPDQSVYDAVNRVRTRAGLPNLATGLSKEAMFERIVHERKIELAIEGHRYWDLRRWRMAVDVLNDKFFTGMKVLSVDDATGEMVTERFDIDFRPKTIFLEKNYYYPIPQGEINKNPNLTQNPGY